MKKHLVAACLGFICMATVISSCNSSENVEPEKLDKDVIFTTDISVNETDVTTSFSEKIISSGSQKINESVPVSVFEIQKSETPVQNYDEKISENIHDSESITEIKDVDDKMIFPEITSVAVETEMKTETVQTEASAEIQINENGDLVLPEVLF